MNEEKLMRIVKDPVCSSNPVLHREKDVELFGFALWVLKVGLFTGCYQQFWPIDLEKSCQGHYLISEVCRTIYSNKDICTVMLS